MTTPRLLRCGGGGRKMVGGCKSVCDVHVCFHHYGGERPFSRRVVSCPHCHWAVSIGDICNLLLCFCVLSVHQDSCTCKSMLQVSTSRLMDLTRWKKCSHFSLLKKWVNGETRSFQGQMTVIKTALWYLLTLFFRRYVMVTAWGKTRSNCCLWAHFHSTRYFQKLIFAAFAPSVHTHSEF